LAPQEKRVEFCYFGGEPMMCFDLIQDITNYIHLKQAGDQRQVRISITSNGTILSQTILDFLQSEKIDLCISLDGPAHIHDKNRRYPNGKGSFSCVEKNLRKYLMQLDSVQVNSVYSPDTVAYLPDTVDYLIQLGVPVIHLNPDICATWTKQSILDFRKALTRISTLYIGCYQRGREIAINLLDSKMILFLKGGYAAEDKCGMGETEWGFAPSGNVYPCERFIGDDRKTDMCIGNIHTGLDQRRRCLILAQRGNRNEACVSCDLKEYCMNWCGCTNHYMTGHSDLASPVMCAMEKTVIQTSRNVFLTLHEQENASFVDHFLHYLSPQRRQYNHTI